jgi:hypothetical protein
MRFKEPLTREQLRAIQERNAGSADVNVLLWEIARLRGQLLVADQLQRMVTSLPGQQGVILNTLRERLRDEPCIAEFPRLPPGA